MRRPTFSTSALSSTSWLRGSLGEDLAIGLRPELPLLALAHQHHLRAPGHGCAFARREQAESEQEDAPHAATLVNEREAVETIAPSDRAVTPAL